MQATASAGPEQVPRRPSVFPDRPSVPSARPDADGVARWTRSPVLRRPLSVRVTGWEIASTSWGGLPYMTKTPPDPELNADASAGDGIARYELAGERHDHPVLQARTVTAMIAGYRLTADPRYLERARANSRRLLETAVPSRGALYLPYRFQHKIAGATIRPVWFSAMAQGLALSALCRMFHLTREPAWLAGAQRLFASFANAPLRGRPWTVHSDACGHLWLEEYPRPVRSEPMRVLNGHIFCVFGVYDYLWLTGSPRAAVIFDAAVTTIADHGREYRVPGSCLLYSLTKPVAKPRYHSTHVWQIARLGSWTGDERFLELSRDLASDFTLTVG